MRGNKKKERDKFIQDREKKTHLNHESLITSLRQSLIQLPAARPFLITAKARLSVGITRGRAFRNAAAARVPLRLICLKFSGRRRAWVRVLREQGRSARPAQVHRKTSRESCPVRSNLNRDERRTVRATDYLNTVQPLTCRPVQNTEFKLDEWGSFS